METVENKRFVYEFGKFLLDPNEKILFSGGQPIRLPAKEFETLLLLVENNGRALTKDEMMAAVWHDAVVEEGNLAKQISRLRKIFDSNGDQFIETLPKHGYRFSADLRLVEEPIVIEKRTVKRMTVSVVNEIEDRPALFSAESRRSLFLRAAAALGVAGLIAIAAFWYLRPNAPATQTGIKSMAVLPLAPLGSEENSRALGLGLTDALITKLGSMKKVVVRPTSAVAPFTNAPNDSLEIGRKLNVDAVLEGTIQEADGRLRVNARLLRTDSGMQIWSQSFDESSRGLFALQDVLSASIAKALAFEISKADSDEIGHRGTENVEAYEKYLRGRFYQVQNTAEGYNRSLELYQQAIALDPNFAEAYAGIADANVLKFNFGIEKADKVIPDARLAVNRALQLNPNLPNAHTSLALIQFLVDRNWPEAERSLQRAIDIDPNNVHAYHRYGYFLMRLGRFDESLEKTDKALELNPLSALS